MKTQDIERLKALDPFGINGDIQRVLLSNHLEKIPFTEVLFHLLEMHINNMETYKEENSKLIGILKEHNLYTDEILFP